MKRLGRRLLADCRQSTYDIPVPSFHTGIVSQETKCPNPPPPLESHLGFWPRYVSNHVSARFAKLLTKHEVTASEWVALRTLYTQPETSHAALIKALGMTKGAASKILTRLEAKGLVPTLTALADTNEDHFFGHLKAVERKALMAQMQALVQRHGLKNLPVS